MATSPRLEILKASLTKKESKFAEYLESHMSDVRSANGQPLNDKRNGASTISRWDRQNNQLRRLNEEIEKTKLAIENEESKINHVNHVVLPDWIRQRINNGQITQWRRHPNTFFVVGVEKARLVWMPEKNIIAHKFVSSIPSKDQYAIFRDIFNSMKQDCK